MARYIDVDKLAETIKYYYEHTGDQRTNAEHYAYGVVLKEIEKQPTADVVEVVRCKDCKHWNCVSRVTEHMGCDIFCGAYEREYPTLPDDFCSYGERRAEE